MIDRKTRIKNIIKIINLQMKQVNKNIANTWDYKKMVTLTNRYNLLKSRKEKLNENKTN
jgi:hypothetical protein